MNPPDKAVRKEVPDFLTIPETEKAKKWVPPQKPQKRNQRLSFKCTKDERKSILDAARKQRGMSAGEYLTSLHRIFQDVNPAPEEKR